MTEPATAPVPEEKKADPAQPEGDLRAELARVRSRNNTLKIIAGVLLSLFIILSAVGFFVYRKIAAAKATFEEAFQSFPPPTQGYQPDYRLLPGQGVASSTSMPASTLGLFSGGLPGGSQGEQFNPEQGERVLKALNKYADRPIVKEFLADLQKNPDMASAFKESKGGNPLAVISKVQNARGMDKLMMKYAMRPEFMKLMMEVMGDPELKPFMGGMTGGMGMPGGMPQGGAVSVPTGQQPVSIQPGDSDGDGEMTFDPSVISGPASKPAPAPSKKSQAPVDSD
jgi:hypothetical protein